MAGVIYQMKDILCSFLDKYCTANIRLHIKEDLEKPEILTQLRVLGLFGKLLTGPWITFVYSNESKIQHLDVIPFFKTCIQTLELIKINPELLISATNECLLGKLNVDSVLMALQNGEFDSAQIIPDGLGEFMSNNDLHVQVLESSEKPNCLSVFLGEEASKKSFYLVSKPNLKNISCSQELIFKQDSSFCFDSADTSVIGSPLKLLAIANLSSTNFSTSSPVAVDEHKNLTTSQLSLQLARKLLNKYIAVLPLDPNPIPMICVLCDGEDRQHTVLIGALKEVKDGRLLIKNFIVTSGKTNLAYLDKSIADTGKYQMKCHHKLLDSNDGLGSVVLEVNWSDKTGRVKINHLNSAQFVLHVSVTVGSDQSPVYSHYCTLQKVSVFIDGLKSGELPALLTANPLDGSRKLLELFEKIKAGLIDVQNTSDNHGLLSGVTKKLKLEPRSDLDFTDLLWTILCQCSTYKDIVYCLKLTFLELRKGELQFFVHADNQTTLAKLIRQSFSGIATLPSLAGRYPLLITAELGLEFIRKNYCTIFVDNNLCTKEEWISFINEKTPVSSEIMDMEELGILMSQNFSNIISKLHHCLELVSVIDAFTEEQDLHNMTQTIFSFYKGNDLDSQLTFSFPVTALRATREMNKVPLSDFRRERTSEGVSVVENALSEFPEVFGNNSNSVSVDSSCSTEKTYFYFKTRESFHFLQKI